MNSSEINSYIVGLCEKVDLEIYKELASTNLHLSSRAQSYDKKKTIVVIADHQTAGIGRQGKAWHSKKGNISFSIQKYFSVPPAKLMGLSLVAGLSVISVLREHLKFDCYLKWPNDIYVYDSKLSGLLIELVNTTSTDCSVITGVGINYREINDPAEYDQPVIGLGNLRANLPTRSELIGRILSVLLKNYEMYLHNGLKDFMQQWQSADYLYGRTVSIILRDKEVHGVALGISEIGELLVEVDGSIIKYNSGEISVRRL